jgi:hypothetical protein
VFQGITVGGQFQVASISIQHGAGSTANKAYQTWVSCITSNASTLGGVRWEMPVSACVAEFINCDNPVAAYTFANLPSGTGSSAPNVREGDIYNTTDCNTSAFLAAGAGGGTGAVAHRKVRCSNFAPCAIARSGTTATVTATAHGLTGTITVNILGATQPEYNGAFSCTVANANTFTYTVAGSPATPATGTITYATWQVIG